MQACRLHESALALAAMLTEKNNCRDNGNYSITTDRCLDQKSDILSPDSKQRNDRFRRRSRQDRTVANTLRTSDRVPVEVIGVLTAAAYTCRRNAFSMDTLPTRRVVRNGELVYWKRSAAEVEPVIRAIRSWKRGIRKKQSDAFQVQTINMVDKKSAFNKDFDEQTTTRQTVTVSCSQFFSALRLRRSSLSRCY